MHNIFITVSDNLVTLWSSSWFESHT